MSSGRVRFHCGFFLSTARLESFVLALRLPTDLKWALAGRSESKLEAVAAECKALNPDRIQPGKRYFRA